MGGKVSAEYYRQYRAKNPAYRERERQRSKHRKRSRKRDYAKEYQQRLRRERLQEPPEGWLLESSLMRRAKQLATRVKKPDMRDTVYDDTHEELVSICVLALCEGKDPGEAMKQWMSGRSKIARTQGPLSDLL